METRDFPTAGMMRRSLRLQETGYYTEDETPSVSYKEVLQRSFHRKTGHRNGKRYTNLVPENMQHDQDEVGTAETGTPYAHGATTLCSCSVRNVSCFFLTVLLSIGMTHMHFQLMTLWLEMQPLRQQMDIFGKFFPQSDTMANYALESQGARILEDLSSDTYWPHRHTGVLWNTICYWQYSAEAQRRVIQGDSSLQPGQCWCFPGARGHLFISLSHSVCISHVTLGHITKSQSPDGYITSAPRSLSVYGMRSTDEEGTCLGKLLYNPDGAAFQTFDLSNQSSCVFRYVKLQIESNWGNANNTCLYSFRVHGKLPVYHHS